MPIPTLPRYVLLPTLGTLLLAAAAVLGDAPARERALDEAGARALAESRLSFARYVFAGEKFPACDFEQPDKVKALLGPYRIKTAFYDRDLRPVESARAPGPYAAVVEIIPGAGPTLRRFGTLYRTPAELKGTTPLEAMTVADLAAQLGLDAGAAGQQVAVIGMHLKGRTLADLARDPQAARLLAGLRLARPGAPLSRKYEDPFALERQWWVSLHRRLTGMDRAFPRPVVCPRPIAGARALIVRHGTAAEAGMKPGAADKIDAVCREWAANDDQPFAVCIVRHGVIVLHRAYGTRDGLPMTVRTKSWMASITKTLSASLMMMLVDQGLVGLDDPVEKYLPALRGHRTGPALTIRHLYTHTSGLEKWPAEWYHDELPDLEERVAVGYPVLQVGKAWGYGGQSYALGGKIIEAVSGEALPQFYRRHLLGPLGCDNTDVTGTHADAFSIPLDMARFGQMLLNRGAYGRLRFFREETFEKMLPERLTRVLGPETKRTFGIGLDGTHERIGHGAASAATFHIDRADDLIVVITRNRMGKNQERYNGRFGDALRDGIVRRTKGASK